ncbi:hypothetical protein [Alicyclobacillus pomorum]|jgi:hypothetical protein|uniref:hypothetical protein n=1 Tax=Alicyclobacillus pomorum TaxID=204470 RepID=UPI000426E998|nr:hypothetical protein [Alicyclobacillus pomorum]
MLSTPSEPQRREKRSRLYMLVVFVGILVMMGFLYIAMKSITTQRLAEHKHSFMGYVTSNHVGKLVEIDSGTGLDPMSYVLQLDHPVPDSEKASFTIDMMQKYVQYDRGSVLTVVYVNPTTKVQIPVAEAHYNRVDGRVSVAVHMDNGETKSLVVKEKW